VARRMRGMGDPGAVEGVSASFGLDSFALSGSRLKSRLATPAILLLPTLRIDFKP
jgi:hypothetical protein